jgi:hypothetical protein
MRYFDGEAHEISTPYAWHGTFTTWGFHKENRMTFPTRIFGPLAFMTLVPACIVGSDASSETEQALEAEEEDCPAPVDETLDWNHHLNDAIIASTGANPASMRIGATVNTAMFDAFNSVRGRYVGIHFDEVAPRGTSARAAVIGAAYRTLSNFFPTQQATLDAQKAASIDALLNDGHRHRLARVNAGLAWGDHVAQVILAWRATDGFTGTYPPWNGGTAPGQWRPTGTPPAPMGNLSTAFTAPFVIESSVQFRPPMPRGLDSADWVADYNAVKAAGSKLDSTRTQYQTDQAFFYNGYSTIDWNEVLLQVAPAHYTSRYRNSRNFARLNTALFDSSITTFAAKLSYGQDPNAVTWRPITAIRLGDTDGRDETVVDLAWTPLISTPNHPEYGTSHPSSHGAGAGVIQGLYGDAQEAFEIEPQYNTTLPTPPGLLPRTYTSVSAMEQEAKDARLFGGMHYPSSITVTNASAHDLASWVLENVAQSVYGDD